MKLSKKLILSICLLSTFPVFAQENSSSSISQEINQAISYPNNWNEIYSIYKENVALVELSAEDKMKIFKLTQEKIVENDKLNRSQFFVIVDRNPKTQNAFLAFYDYLNKTVTISEPTKISSGSYARQHFITPLGWFDHLTENGSYRALGTKNENGIRGIGKKGMRVFDFGWNRADAGWRNNFPIDIRFQMHATDPDHLEKKLGVPASKGCVRINSNFNDFLDKYGILDYHYENANNTKAQWVLRKDREPVKNAGSYLLVIDTAPEPKGM